MSRRPGTSSRRLADGGSLTFISAMQSKARSSPLLSVALLVMVIVVVLYCYSGSDGRISNKAAFTILEAGFSCTIEVLRALPLLKNAYGDGMKKVLHVGPDTCAVVAELLKEEGTEAWGVEPYEFDGVENYCKMLVRKGVVRVADIKYPLPYRANSFSVAIVSDALDHLSPRNLNKTLPELARVSTDGVVILTGYPGHRKAKVTELSKFGRPAKFRSSTWWVKYFLGANLEVNEAIAKKFEQVAVKGSYNPTCQIFHLKSAI